MLQEKLGILYGIGVGPGDPEMMTIKAVRAIQNADVICLPKKEKETCRSYCIAKEVVPEIEEKEMIFYDFEMVKDEAVLQELHQSFYEHYKNLLHEGKNLAFLTIGDPTVYSTFGYMQKLAEADGIPVQIVNGISAYVASAAVTNRILCEKEEHLHILSGQGSWEESLNLPGTKVIMKSGKNLGEIREKLLQLEKNNSVEITAVQNCGFENQEIYIGAEQIPEKGSYMMTILIKEK